MNRELKVRALELLRAPKAELTLRGQLRSVPDLDLDRPARSVIFIHHCFYHFLYLARALRERGWRAVCVSLDAPQGPSARFQHGEDLNLFSPDPYQMRANAQALFRFAKRNFQLMHFAGDGNLSFFPWNFGEQDPADIVEWRTLGKKVAYTISGCRSATSQTSVKLWSRDAMGRSLCHQCVFENRPDVCSDQLNLQWASKLGRHCDMTFAETNPALDYLVPGPKVVRGPHTGAMDERFWAPDIEIPPAHRVPRIADEVLVLHAFGNYESRQNEERNIKGTPAIAAAVERLQAEGHKVRFLFATGLRNVDLRYYQAQADIIVDQLWAGRYGAAAREGMMLGKPVISYLNRREPDARYELEALKEVPIVSASVDTIYDALKDLVVSREKRLQMGALSREYAIKWHGMANCAARYEQVFDRMFGLKAA